MIDLHKKARDLTALATINFLANMITNPRGDADKSEAMMNNLATLIEAELNNLRAAIRDEMLEEIHATNRALAEALGRKE